MKKRNPFYVFDWLFTDASDDAARRFALIHRPKETEVLMDLIDVDALIHFPIWDVLPKEHPVGELWLETETDLKATIYLAYGGFFRQALTVLRSWFEIAVHGVYFSDHWGQPTERYEEWRKGERNAPAHIQDLARALASRTDMSMKVDEPAILARLEPVYSVLSKQAHAQGLDVFNLQEGRDNVPRFLEKSFDIWYRKVLEAFDAMCFLYEIFFLTPLATYFKKSPEETKRLQNVEKSLSGLMPSFAELVKHVLNP